jgi:hypothetical protein
MSPAERPLPSPPAVPPPATEDLPRRAALARKTLFVSVIAVATGLGALPFFVPLSTHPLAIVAVIWNLGAFVNSLVLLGLARRLRHPPQDSAEIAATLRRAAVLVLGDMPVPFLALGVFVAESHAGDYGPGLDTITAALAFLAALLVVPVWSGLRLAFFYRFAKELDEGAYGVVLPAQTSA